MPHPCDKNTWNLYGVGSDNSQSESLLGLSERTLTLKLPGAPSKMLRWLFCRLLPASLWLGARVRKEGRVIIAGGLLESDFLRPDA